MPPIFWITGPPASGKSTTSVALMQRFDRGVHLPVDDVRLWVVKGLADSVPWTDETERQFKVAERGICGLVRAYHEAGFAVAVDHCRNLGQLDAVIRAEMPDLPVIRVCLIPDLKTNLHRNHSRTNKTFDPRVLDETIQFTNERFRAEQVPGWHFIDNSGMTVEETVDMIAGLLP